MEILGKKMKIAGIVEKKIGAHQKKITSISRSKDKNLLLTLSTDRVFKTWNTEDLKEVRTTKIKGIIPEFGLIENTEKVITNDRQSVLRINMETGVVSQRMDGHTGFIRSIALAPISDQIISGGADNTLRFWDKNGEETRTLKGHQMGVTSLAISTNEKFFCSGSGVGIVKVGILQTGEFLTQYGEQHRGPITHLCFLGEQAVISIDSTRQMMFYDLKSNETTKFEQLHEKRITGLTKLKSEKEIITASLDGKIVRWDTDMKKIKSVENYEGILIESILSLSNEKLLIGDAEGNLILTTV